MPAFDAGTVVEGLDFTFKPFVRGCSGTIKEPTDQQIAAFLRGVKDVTKQVQKEIPDVPEGDAAALLDAMDELDPELVVSLMAQMAQVYADLCSDYPGKDQILGLPMRHRQLFFTWLQTEVMSPEAGPGAGRAQVTQLPRAAAG